MVTVGAGTRFAVGGGSSERVAVEAAPAAFAVLAGRVVLTDTPAAFSVADVGVTVAVAGHAARKRSSVGRFVTVTGSARLAKLTDVAFGTVAAFDPAGRRTASSTPGRFQFDVVQETDAARRVSGADLQRRQIGEDADEIARRQTRIPAVIGVFVQPELIELTLHARQLVALAEDRQRYAKTGALQDDVFDRSASSDVADAQRELQQLVVTGPLVAQEAFRSREVNWFTSRCAHTNVLNLMTPIT